MENPAVRQSKLETKFIHEFRQGMRVYCRGTVVFLTVAVKSNVLRQHHTQLIYIWKGGRMSEAEEK